MAKKAVKIKPKKTPKIRLTQLSLFEVIEELSKNTSTVSSKSSNKNPYVLQDAKGTFFL